MGLVMRLLYAVAIGVIAWLVCTFFGGFLALTHQAMLAYLGAFLVTWAVLIGILAAILTFVSGGTFGSLFHRA
jgi:hypothetical protein